MSGNRALLLTAQFGCVRASKAMLVWATLLACVPEFDDDLQLVNTPRVLAVRSDPAESAPGKVALLQALLATPHGTKPPTLEWQLCSAPKPITENNGISAECLKPESLQSAGQGFVVEMKMPRDACRLFGPDTPSGGLRPRDPDITGGYFQPLLLRAEDTTPAFCLSRLRCGLADAPADIARAFAQEYISNNNPEIAKVLVRADERAVSSEKIPAGSDVAIEVRWAAAARERYVYFNRDTQTLEPQRESLQLAWYSDLTAFVSQTPSEDAAGPNREIGHWKAPSRNTKGSLWLVLRDSRGGSSFSTLPIAVVASH